MTDHPDQFTDTPQPAAPKPLPRPPSQPELIKGWSAMVAIALIVSLVVNAALTQGTSAPALFDAPAAGGAAPADRVWNFAEKSGTLRCGYITGETITRDADNQLHGTFVDLAKALSEKLDRLIVFEYETAPDRMVGELAEGKFDMICSGISPNSKTLGKLRFIAPPLFRKPAQEAALARPVYLAVPVDEPKLANALEAALATMLGDGSLEQIAAKAHANAPGYYKPALPYHAE